MAGVHREARGASAAVARHPRTGPLVKANARGCKWTAAPTAEPQE